MKDAATTDQRRRRADGCRKLFLLYRFLQLSRRGYGRFSGAQCGGYDLGAKAHRSAFLDTTAIKRADMDGLLHHRLPDAALKLLNLTFTDPDVCNLIIYGLEGEDY